MIIGIQLFAILFSLFLLYVTFIHFKKRELSVIEAAFFSIIWLGAVFITVFPSSLDFILHTFNILRLLDLATILGFMVLIGIAFRNYLRIRELEKKIEALTRKNALGILRVKRPKRKLK